MKLELTNKDNTFSIEQLTESTYHCDLCPDFITSQVVATIYYNHRWTSQGEVFSESVEIKFCANCIKIIAGIFNSLEKDKFIMMIINEK